jgi:hypothetical protein
LKAVFSSSEEFSSFLFFMGCNPEEEGSGLVEDVEGEEGEDVMVAGPFEGLVE